MSDPSQAERVTQVSYCYYTVSQSINIPQQVGVERLRKALEAEEVRKNLKLSMVEDASHQDKGTRKLMLNCC